MCFFYPIPILKFYLISWDYVVKCQNCYFWEIFLKEFVLRNALVGIADYIYSVVFLEFVLAHGYYLKNVSEYLA